MKHLSSDESINASKEESPTKVPYVPMIVFSKKVRDSGGNNFFLADGPRIEMFRDCMDEYDEGYGRLILNGEIVLDNFGTQFKDDQDAVRICMADFKYLKEIGRGEQGRIFLAIHAPTDTAMAIKEIPLEMSQTQMKGILVELDVLCNNKSPYIIHFFGAFYTKSSVYFCMEVMDLGSLDDVIRALRPKREASPEPFYFPDEFLVPIISSVTSGLHFLSKHLSIMHRDVKPTNILLHSRGKIKLCDFGVSGYLVKSAAKTYVGSMTYMAPERVRANQNTPLYTTQADVWSLGATLFELVAGSPLFAASGFDSAFAHLMAITVDPSPSIPEGVCSPAMADFILFLLSKEPKARPTFEQILEMPMITTITADQEAMERNFVRWMEENVPERVPIDFDNLDAYKPYL